MKALVRLTETEEDIFSANEVIPSLRPLVTGTRDGKYFWISRGYGWVLDTRGFGTWGCVVGDLVGGTVLNESQVAALVSAYGRPVMP